MRSMWRAIFAATFLAFATCSAAWCADISGVVTGPGGKPVPGIKISVLDSSHNLLGSALTGTDGKYKISGVVPGTYTFTLNPMATPFKPGESVATLTDLGLLMPWQVSPDDTALDQAGPPGPPPGPDPGLLTIAGVGVGTGAGLGAAAGAGAFNGPNNSPPPSPHM